MTLQEAKAMATYSGAGTPSDTLPQPSSDAIPVPDHFHWNAADQYLKNGLVVGEIRPHGDSEWWSAYLLDERGRRTSIAGAFEYQADAKSAVEQSVRR